ncbi:hypothetical protein ABH931_000587 [Streptacidiphilus sp. MAP12-33]
MATAPPRAGTVGTPVPDLRNFAESHGVATASVGAAPDVSAVEQPALAMGPPRAVDVLRDALQRVQDIRQILSSESVVAAPSTAAEADRYCRLVDEIVQQLRDTADGAPPCPSAEHPDRRNGS